MFSCWRCNFFGPTSQQHTHSCDPGRQPAVGAIRLVMGGPPDHGQAEIWSGDAWVPTGAAIPVSSPTAAPTPAPTYLDLSRMTQLANENIDKASAMDRSTLDAGKAMRQFMDQIEVREIEAAKVIEGLGALGAILRRRPVLMDARTEVISYLRRELAGSAPVESWQKGAYFGGTTISEDNTLEPGVVRVHTYMDADPFGARRRIVTQEIVIGDL